MRFLQLLMAVILLGCFSSNVLADDFNLDSPRNTKLWRFELDNDTFLGEDSNFSNGWSIQYHTLRYSTWEETDAYDWVKWVGQSFPTLGDEGSIVRYGQGIGQNILTPENIEATSQEIEADILNGDIDMPYAGTLHYTLNWQRYNPETLANLQVTIGLLGEEARGEWTQKFVHDDMGQGDIPMGWDTQRDTEPIVNFGYSHQWRVLQFGQYDNAWGGQMMMATGFHLGNLITAAEVGFSFRYGWNISKGFNAYPAPPGRGMFSAAFVPKPASASPHSVEFVLGARATGIAYSVLYDGSEFIDDEREVEREGFIFAGLFGINYHHYDMMSIRFTILVSSDLLDEDSLPPPKPLQEQTSTDNSYGTLMFDYHF
jgi:lipid A 3-O-deacylase